MDFLFLQDENKPQKVQQQVTDVGPSKHKGGTGAGTENPQSQAAITVEGQRCHRWYQVTWASYPGGKGAVVHKAVGSKGKRLQVSRVGI